MTKNVTYGNCWVAYLDILGFKNMLLNFRKQHQGHLDIFVDVYFHDIIKAINKSGDYNPDYVSITWFSDSFLLYSHDDSLKSFVAIEQAARHFFWRVICMGMPLRGALGFGEFYGDMDRSIFLGQALIETYHYAENQDWIGFVATPSAYSQLDGTDIILSHLDYVEHTVSFKRKTHSEAIASENLYAYKPRSKSGMLDPMLRKIREMDSLARLEHPENYDDVYKPKYERTIEFLSS